MLHYFMNHNFGQDDRSKCSCFLLYSWLNRELEISLENFRSTAKTLSWKTCCFNTFGLGFSYSCCEVTVSTCFYICGYIYRNPNKFFTFHFPNGKIDVTDLNKTSHVAGKIRSTFLDNVSVLIICNSGGLVVLNSETPSTNSQSRMFCVQ